jgi:large repetitive protein
MKHFLVKRTGVLILVLGLILGTLQSRAQYTATTIESGSKYTALTKDNSNNVYGVRLNLSTGKGEVIKYTNGNPTPAVIYNNLEFDGAGSWIYPWGIAINSGGDVFVTSANQPVGWQIVKLTYPSYAATVIHSGNYYSVLAVDAANNLYAMEYNSATITYQLVRYPAGAEAGAGTPIYNGFTYHTGTTSSYPWGIVFDSQNNIYLLDFWENSGGRLVKLTAPGYAPTELSTNKSFSALAIDGANNIYTIEGVNSNPAIAHVMKYTNLAGAGTELYNGLTAAHPDDAWGLAVTSDGKVFVGDQAVAPGGRLITLTPPVPPITVSSITRADASPTNAATVNYTVTLSGNATNVTISDFRLTTSTGIIGSSIASVTGSGNTYTVTVNTGTGTGSLRLNLRGLNMNPVPTNVPFLGEIYTIDKTAPTGSLAVNNGAVATNNTAVTLNITGSDASGGAVEMSFSNDNTAWSTWEALATTKSWALTTGEGVKTVYMQLRDPLGNVSPFQDAITLDQTAPNTTITAGPPAVTNSTTASFTFTSNETGTFEASLDGGAFTALTSPATLNGLAAGSHSFSVRAIDAAGNVDATPDTYNWTIDLTAPAITSVSVPANGYYKVGDVLSFTVNFDESIVTNTTGGTPYINVIIGSSVKNATFTSATSNSMTFQYTVQNGDMDMDGIALGTMQLNGGTIKDAVGNNANLTLNNVGVTSGVFVNTAAPTVTITGTPSLNAPWTATITFNEPVTGFTVADITATNATIGTFQTSDNIIYTVTVTPVTGGPVTITVPAGVAVNIGGNGNLASNTISYVYDATPPVVTSVSVPANGYYKAGDVLTFTVNFSENIIVTGTPSLAVIIGSTPVQAGYLGGSGTSALTYGYTVQPGDNDMNGISLGANLQLNGGTLTDAATNNANLTLNAVGSTSLVFVNTAAASVTLSTAAPALINTPFTVTIVFSGAVTGLTPGDFNTTNATISNFQTSDNITYSVLVTPAVEGTVSIQLPANVAVNIGNNGNSASNTISLTYDATPPVVTSVTVPANGYYKAGTNLDFTIHFSENVIVNTTGGTPYLNVILNSGTVPASYIGGTGTNALLFRYTVVAGNMDMDGIALGVNYILNGSTLKDAATNNAITTLQNAGNTSNVFVNTSIPSVLLSTTAASLVNAPFTVTTAFSETVTGLTATDFTTTNATISNIQTTDNITYTVLVTPSADGPVSIQLPANAAENVGTNGNTASNTITRNMDATAPVITAAQNFSILQNSTAGTQVGRVLATEAVGTLQNWTITSDGSGGAFAIDATGTISVQNGTILNNNIGNTVSVLVTVSDGLNTSVATAISIRVTPINKAPVLDAIPNQVVCADPVSANAYTIQLTGMGAVEPTQTYTVSVASNQAYFSGLSVTASGLINYRLNNNVTSGVTTITVTIKDNGGTANGGVDTYQRNFTITINPLPVITITSDLGNSVSKGEIVHLTATGGGTYLWEFDNTIISGQQTAVAEVRPQTNTSYWVRTTTAAGCSDKASINIAVVEDFKVDATNVLTPNGDGKNDKWVIRNIDSYPDNEVKIFDRTGRLVYSQRNYNNNWDGKVNGHPLAEGTYYYFLTIASGTKTAKGFITIILKAN